ncbi:YxeA family protein [Bacillus cereus]|nr:YxeA family protein [Bacillus cereus]
MKKFIIAAVFLVVGIGTYLINGSATIDRMNPFIDLENYYTVINTEGESLGKDKGYEYTVKGYDKNGKEKEIIFETSSEIPKGTVYHIITRGKSVHDKTDLDKAEYINNIPYAAKTKLGLK